MVNVYNLAEFFVLATLYECFPLPLLEAMICGCPALVPSTGGCSDQAGQAARYVDPRDEVSYADGMMELTRSPLLRAEMRAAGLGQAGRYAWQKTAEMTLEVLETIVPAGRVSSPSVASSKDSVVAMD
jgi:glycosyltransferase involved in cell wall biosynthesis